MGSECSLRMSLRSTDRMLVSALAAPGSSLSPLSSFAERLQPGGDAGGFAGWIGDGTGPCLLAPHIPAPWRGDRDVVRAWLLWD